MEAKGTTETALNTNASGDFLLSNGGRQAVGILVVERIFTHQFPAAIRDEFGSFSPQLSVCFPGPAACVGVGQGRAGFVSCAAGFPIANWLVHA